MAMTTTRLTAAERKDDVLDAALIEFADRGYEGTSTEDIARRAGISQPYLFRLFGTKKELYIASRRPLLPRHARALPARGRGACGAKRPSTRSVRPTWSSWRPNRVWLRAQMQGYAASEDPDIRRVVREGFGDLVAYVRRVSGADWPEIWQFFATGMLLNVLASMHVNESPEPWMSELLAGCGKEL